MKRNLMSELTEGIDSLTERRKDQPAWKSWNWPMYTPFTPTNIIDRAKKESQEIEQILGKALGYPWYKDDLKNFPNATEADGVCVAPNTAVGTPQYRLNHSSGKVFTILNK